MRDGGPALKDYPFIHQYHGGIADIVSACRRADDVARLLHGVGLEKLADRLGSAVDEILEGLERIKEGHRGSEEHQNQQSKEFTGAVFSAVIHNVFRSPADALLSARNQEKEVG